MRRFLVILGLCVLAGSGLVTECLAEPPDSEEGGAAQSLAHLIGRPLMVPVGENTEFPIAKKLTAFLVSDGTFVRTLTNKLGERFSPGQLIELEKFFTGEIGKAWLEKSLAIRSSQGKGAQAATDSVEPSTAKKELALQAAEGFLAGRSAADAKPGKAATENLGRLMAQSFSEAELEGVKAFFGSELGQSWLKSRGQIDLSLATDAGKAGCVLSIVSPSLTEAIPKVATEGDVDLPFEKMSPVLESVYDVCSCVWEKGTEKWGPREFAKVQGTPEFSSFVSSVVESGACNFGPPPASE